MDLHVFGGDDLTGVIVTSYPSGATIDKMAPGTDTWDHAASAVEYLFVRAILRGTGGATASLELVDLAAPDTPLVEMTSTSTTGAVIASGSILASTSTVTYGVKLKTSDAAKAASAWGITLVSSLSYSTLPTTGAATTVADLITGALRRINYLGQGETPTADDLVDAFVTLKQLMGQWRLERLFDSYVKRTTWTLVPGKGGPLSPYTVGSGGDVNISRPPLPNSLAVRYLDTSATPSLERPLIPLGDDAYANIPQKDLTSPLPGHYYYSPTFAGHLGSLYFWLVPTSSTLEGVIYAPAAVADFISPAEAIVVPDGYEHFFIENLAVHLAPEFRENIPLDPTLKQSAEETKDNLKRANVRMMDLTVDGALVVRHGLRYSIFSDR